MKCRILIDRDRLKRGEPCLMLYDENNLDGAPEYARSIKGSGDYELIPQAKGEKGNGFDGYLYLLVNREDFEVEK